ncbi:MAG: hypothetical protein HQK79_01045 [Desulfobacterales bacterium]|nr:hypothetical protein [Desulfobacterales bacterium]
MINKRERNFAVASLIIILALIYSNSFNCAWLFDDTINIMYNGNVHMKWFSLPEIIKSFHFGDNIANRPFAYFTFALNYFVGELNVVGYHIVNFIIHCITSIFLFLLIYKTLKLPILNEEYGNKAYHIALLATFCWATNPVQTMAVTYIVQRMTSLSGMFYIIAMFCYLKGRISQHLFHSIIFFILCFICGVLAVTTKEIAATLPITIILYDLFFIQGINNKNVNRTIKILFYVISGSLIIFFKCFKFSDLLDYSAWIFTMKEKLLTEPRVFFYYISLLLYPLEHRLMLDHDIPISKGLMDPWTTLLAISSLITIIILSLIFSRKKPFLSFCIIYFFLNHLIEGSFIAIDIAFEHRNYIPSMFLFPLIAIFIIYVIDYFAYRKSIQLVMAFGITLFIASNAHSTYTRNEIFSTAKLFWWDSAEKSPNISRCHIGLGGIYLGEEENARKGLVEMYLALNLRHFAYKQIASCHVNIATYYLNVKKDEDRALPHLFEAIKVRPSMVSAYNNIALAMINKGYFNIASLYMQIAIDYMPVDAELFTSYAQILFKKGDIDNAVKNAVHAMNIMKNENYYRPYAVIAEFYKAKGDYDTALYYWEKYFKYEPLNIHVNLALVELYAKDKKKNNAKLINTVGAILALKGDKSIKELFDIKEKEKNNLVYVPEKKVLLPIIEEVLRELSSQAKLNIAKSS